MRGHGKILEARLAGQKPPFVFVNDYPCKTDWFEFGEHATVCTANKPIHVLDMRFLVGLKVSISAATEDRAKALFDLAKACGASVVAACHVQTEKHHTHQTGWAEIWHKEASHG